MLRILELSFTQSQTSVCFFPLGWVCFQSRERSKIKLFFLVAPLPPSKSFFVVPVENGCPLFYHLKVQPPLWFEIMNLQRDSDQYENAPQALELPCLLSLTVFL